MTKKLLLTFVLLLTAVTGAFADDNWCGENVRWVLTGESPNYTLTITGTGAMADYDGPYDQPWFNYAGEIKTVVIVNGVTTIGEGVFTYCSNLTSITIPASVTTIGGFAFAGCLNLATVSFAAGSQLETIGGNAFQGCEVLTSITIPANVTSIGEYAFEGCSGLTTVSFAAGSQLTSIGENAFEDCEVLTSITIPANVTTIGEYAFNECSGLTSIEIPASVTSIDWGAFANTGLTTVSFAAGSQLTTIGGCAFNECPGLTSIEIPASVTTIGERAFDHCSNLATISFAEDSQLTTIGEGVFNSCSDLTSITIPASVTSIGDEAFIYCSKLETMTVDDGNAVYDSRNGCNAIIEKSSNTLIIGCNGSTIPDGVTTIGEGAFAVCQGLTSIEIPASVTTIGGFAFSGCVGLTTISFAAGSQLTTIGGYAFESCQGLTSIEIPASVTSIGEVAFYDCSMLASVSFAAGSQLTTIGGYAFEGCVGLTSITIPASVTSIGEYAFEFCSNLATVTVYAQSCTLGVDAFMGCFNLTNIYVLSNYVGTYKSAWSAYADKISVMFDGISTTTVNIPNDMTVKSVLYNRTFTEGKPSTVMLPFSKDVDDISGGKFYTFDGVQKENDKWVATMKEVTGSIEANTPYLFMPTGTSLTFTGGATLNTTGGDKETADQGSHWTFKGTYEYKEWKSGGANAEEIGKAYGFAGVAKDGINVGDFVKVASGAKIRPMGCYLLWNDTPNASRAAARGAATEELPQSITVRLVSADGEVTSIDVRCKMEEGRGDVYYDLSGRLLQGKPTKKGLYINNGKKIVIK